MRTSRIILLFLFISPFVYSNELFLECTKSSGSDFYHKSIESFHIKLDEQVVKSRSDYVPYTQGANGVITWEEIRKNKDGLSVSHGYFIDRITGKLDMYGTYSKSKNYDHLQYMCEALITKF